MLDVQAPGLRALVLAFLQYKYYWQDVSIRDKKKNSEVLFFFEPCFSNRICWSGILI